MVYDKLEELIQQIQNSEEYNAYQQARERALRNDTTRALLTQYHQLQVQVQAKAISGENDQELLQKLQKLGELLQFDKEASAYLLAEYQMHTVLSDIYKRLAQAMDIDLGMLEA